MRVLSIDVRYYYFGTLKIKQMSVRVLNKLMRAAWIFKNRRKSIYWTVNTRPISETYHSHWDTRMLYAGY